METKTKMKKVIAEVLEPIPELHKKFLEGKEFAVKIFAEAMMPLSIEVQDWGAKKVFIVAHYFEQNGDLVPDPDMMFLLDNSDPLEISQALGYSRGYETTPDGKMVPTKDLPSLREFANTWAENIKNGPYRDSAKEGNYRIL